MAVNPPLLRGVKTRTSQPQETPRINWSNPLSRGLIFAGVPGNPINLVDSLRLPNASFTRPTLGVRQAGRVVAAGGYQAAEPASAATPEAKFDLSVLTALVVASQDATGNIEYAFFRGNGSSAPGWGVGLYSGSNNGALAVIGSYGYSPTGGTFNTNPHTAILRGDGTNATVIFDGVVVGTGTYTAPVYQYSSQRSLVFGAVNGTGGALNIRPALGLLWNRALSDAEIASMNANPEQLFTPSATTIPSPILLPRAPISPAQSRLLGTSTGTLATVTPMRGLSRVRVSQPQVKTAINWSNPLSQGLIFAALPGSPDLISGTMPLPLGAASVQVFEQGRSFYSPGVSSDGWYWPLPSNHPVYGITTQDTTLVVAKRIAGSAYNTLLGIPYRNGAWAVPYFAYSPLNAQSDGDTGTVSGGSNSSTFNAAISAAAFYQNNVSQVYGSSRNSSRVRFFRGALQFGSDVAITSFSPDFSNKQPLVLFNQSNSAVGSGMQAHGGLALMWNRELSPAEFAQAANNPYQLFTPTPVNGWVAP